MFLTTTTKGKNMKNKSKEQTQYYTYKQILIGLRNEFLIFQKKLDQLSEYIITIEDLQNTFSQKKERDNYYFNLYQNPFNGELPELVLDRLPIKKRLLEYLGLLHSPTRVFMVKSNNGMYYPLKNNNIGSKLFNIIIKPGYEKKFCECVDEILNSSFAKYIQLINPLNSTINDSLGNTIFSLLSPKLSSYGLELRTTNAHLTYIGRNNMLKFCSVKKPKEKYTPLTQELLNDITNIKFSRDDFSEYHQSIIDKTIADERPILLGKEYQPQTFANFDIESTEKELILSISQNKRRL